MLLHASRQACPASRLCSRVCLYRSFTASASWSAAPSAPVATPVASSDVAPYRPRLFSRSELLVFDNRLACRTQIGLRYGRSGQLLRALWRMSAVQGKRELRLLSYHTDAAVTQRVWDSLLLQMAGQDGDEPQPQPQPQQPVAAGTQAKAIQAMGRLFPPATAKEQLGHAPATEMFTRGQEEESAGALSPLHLELQDLPQPLRRLLRSIEQERFRLGGLQHSLTLPARPLRLSAPVPNSRHNANCFMLAVAFRCRPAAAETETAEASTDSSAAVPVVRLQVRLQVYEPVPTPDNKQPLPAADSMRGLRQKIELRLKQFKDGFFKGGRFELLEGKTGESDVVTTSSSSSSSGRAEQRRGRAVRKTKKL